MKYILCRAGGGKLSNINKPNERKNTYSLPSGDFTETGKDGISVKSASEVANWFYARKTNDATH